MRMRDEVIALEITSFVIRQEIFDQHVSRRESGVRFIIANFQLVNGFICYKPELAGNGY